MLHIPIQGIRDGNHTVLLEAECSDSLTHFPEFFGKVVVSGVLKKFGKRLIVECTSVCKATLICDYSLDEYQEEITADLKADFIIDSELYLMQKHKESDDVDEVKILRDEDKFIDITDEVMQELAVALPLKRIAPTHRHKSIKDILDDSHIITDDSNKLDDSIIQEQWNILQSVTFKK